MRRTPYLGSSVESMPAHHGSESFFVEGEGLVGTQLGGRHGNAPDPLTESEEPTASAPQQLAAGQAPPFRFSRCGPKGDAARTGRHQAAGDRDGRGRRRAGRRAGRLHLPRPVRRPRPDLRPYGRRARRRRHACGARAGSLAAARPGLPVRRGAEQPGVRQVLRGRRVAPQGRHHQEDRTGRSQEGPRPAARRRGADRADPGPPQRREPDRRPDPRGDDELPQQRSSTTPRPRPRRNTSARRASR